MNPDERNAFVNGGFLNPVDVATRDRWTASVAGLLTLRDRFRELSRQALATPGPTAPPELRKLILDLEERTREKTSLDSLVWNSPTQEYLRLTLTGKGVLEDLLTWQKRLEHRSFEEFQKEMAAYREGLFQTIYRARVINRGLAMMEAMRSEDEATFGSPFTTVDLRFASVILAKRPVDPNLLARSFDFFNTATNWGSWNKEDRLVGSAVLASLAGDPSAVRASFERLRILLTSHGILPEDRIFAAASMADLDPSWWDLVLTRIDEIRRQRPALNALMVCAMARSSYPVDEALARFDAALSGMAARGYRNGIHVEAAASILASAPVDREEMVNRFVLMATHLAGVFDPLYAPSAMVAANSLEPLEAIDVFRDCISAITRSSFFDLTLEIEDLALVMSYGVAPLGLGYLAANLPPGAIPQAPAAVAAVPLYGPSWYAWHTYWVFRPLGRYIATHPVHIHTVAAFG
jgi:hypothetical protein